MQDLAGLAKSENAMLGRGFCLHKSLSPFARAMPPPQVNQKRLIGSSNLCVCCKDSAQPGPTHEKTNLRSGLRLH